MVYPVIALALYMPAPYGEVLRSLLEGARWLAGPAAAPEPADVHVPCPSAITQRWCDYSGHEHRRRHHGDAVLPPPVGFRARVDHDRVEHDVAEVVT